MKTLLLTAITAIVWSPAISLRAQDFNGVATYETQLRLPEIELSEEQKKGLSEEMVNLLSERMKAAGRETYVLHFDRTASLYEEQEQPQEMGDANANIVINTSGNDQNMIHYTNLQQHRYVSQSENFDKLFLVKDSLRRPDWKLENETKQIGNYTCHKATYTITISEQAEGPGHPQTVTAWYTTDIPLSFGPSRYWGLPGLILELNDGMHNYLCSKIVLNPKEKTTIKEPSKGKTVTQKELDTIVQEKAKEYEAEMRRKYPNSNGNGFHIEVIQN